MTDTATNTGTDTATGNPNPPGSVRNPLPNDADATTDTTTGTDTAAELAKWKAMSKKHEAAAAKAAKELESLRASSMTEQEKAVAKAIADAKLEARTEVMRDVGGKLADAAIRVAAAGRSVDVDALLEGIDSSKFLDDNGDPNQRAITAWMERVAPVSDADKRKTGNVVPREGSTTGAVAGDPATGFARFLNDQLNG